MTRPSIIVERLGDYDAALLSVLVGGTYIYIPTTTRPPANGSARGFERMVNLLGYRIAVKLILHFPGERMYVRTANPQIRNMEAAVIAMSAEGMSAAQIARKLRCSNRSIYAIRARANPPA